MHHVRFNASQNDMAERGAGTQQPEAEVSAIFSKYDSDGSGDIDVDELTDALRELGLPCDAKQSEMILRKFAPPETIVKGEKVIKKEKTELNCPNSPT